MDAHARRHGERTSRRMSSTTPTPAVPARAAGERAVSRYGANDAPRVGSQRLVVALWIATGALCALSVALLRWPVSASQARAALFDPSRGTLLVIAPANAGPFARVGDRASLRGSSLTAVVERVDERARAAAEIEAEQALPGGTIARIADPACVAFARVQGALDVPSGVQAPRSVTVDLWGAPRTAWSFLRSDAPKASSVAR